MEPLSATFAIVLDSCKFGGFGKEARNIWDYSQKSSIKLDANVLTSYIECLIDLQNPSEAVDLIIMGLQGKGRPLRCITPDAKTIKHARSMLLSRRFTKELSRLEKYI